MLAWAPQPISTTTAEFPQTETVWAFSVPACDEGAFLLHLLPCFHRGITALRRASARQWVKLWAVSHIV
jgi:hypothetical protein